MIPFQLRRLYTVLSRPMQTWEAHGRVHQASRLLFALGFPLLELGNAGLLALDHVLFPGFTKTPVRAPVFILACPRSGTTFLHRLMALDEERFTPIKLYQLLFPALTAQALLEGLATLDRSAGGHLARTLMRAEDGLFGAGDHIHRIRLSEPEEDEVLFMHPFASKFYAQFFPSRTWLELVTFDTLEPSTRNALMGFYRDCVRRQLYRAAPGRALLSKNVMFCSKVKSLLETFPDARFIYLVRNPAQALCSAHSMMTEIYRAQGITAPVGTLPRHEELLETCIYWYRYTLDCVDAMPPSRRVIVRYEDLVAEPRRTLEHIYRTLEMPLSEHFSSVLDREQQKARQYRSRHQYHLEAFGLSHAEIEAAAGHIYDRFGYPRRGGEQPRYPAGFRKTVGAL